MELFEGFRMVLIDSVSYYCNLGYILGKFSKSTVDSGYTSGVNHRSNDDTTNDETSKRQNTEATNEGTTKRHRPSVKLSYDDTTNDETTKRQNDETTKRQKDKTPKRRTRERQDDI